MIKKILLAALLSIVLSGGVYAKWVKIHIDMADIFTEFNGDIISVISSDSGSRETMNLIVTTIKGDKNLYNCVHYIPTMTQKECFVLIRDKFLPE